MKPEALENLKSLCEVPGGDYQLNRLLKEVNNHIMTMTMSGECTLASPLQEQ